MPATLRESEGKSYLDCPAGSVRIANEGDILDLLALFAEHETSLLLLDGGCLDESFFDLKSGLAGAMLLKLSTYRIRAAVITSEKRIGTGKFAEFVLETNRGNQFRVYQEREAALNWLVGTV